MALCLDTGHHAYRGGDPVAFFRRHHARIPYLHLKSVDRAEAGMGRARAHPLRHRRRQRHVLRARPGRGRLHRLSRCTPRGRLRRLGDRRAGHVPRAVRQAVARSPSGRASICARSAWAEGPRRNQHAEPTSGSVVFTENCRGLKAHCGMSAAGSSSQGLAIAFKTSSRRRSIGKRSASAR